MLKKTKQRPGMLTDPIARSPTADRTMLPGPDHIGQFFPIGVISMIRLGPFNMMRTQGDQIFRQTLIV